VRQVIDNYEILGGPATFNVVWSTKRFRDQNPKAYAAFVAAFHEATDQINKNKRASAETYKRMSGTSESIEELIKELNDPKVSFTLEPHRLMVTAAFMHKIGRVKTKPSSWKDLFFENIHHLAGN
jgi:NitT/TauT family transport system substrate-binding protein